MLLLGPDFVAPVQRLECNDVFTIGQHHAADRDFVHLPDGFTNDREGRLCRRGAMERIRYLDLAAVNKLADLDGSR